MPTQGRPPAGRHVYAGGVASVRPRIFSYAVTLDGDRSAESDRGGAALPHDEDAWTPEHLVLTALARCVLASLDHHARRAGATTVVAGATAAGKVTLREADERFALVEVDVELAVALEPPHDRWWPEQSATASWLQA
jgi:organic hydroperoxide reductase OsmC/OhrA